MMMDQEARQQFIEAWGSLGMLWGINRSMARIQALLIVSEQPRCLDELAEQLQISRGNTSMSLKELRSWGVIRRVHQPGDRRDFYVAEPDFWTVLFRICAERKKRELDPAVEAVRAALAATGSHQSTVSKRLQEMEELLSTFDHLLRRLLADPEISRAMLRLVSSQVNRAE
jgi:DNA-binding transcriptional regulator GbsR (MarR family)